MNMRGALARRSYGAAALIWLCLIAPSFAKCAPSPNNGAQSDDGGVEYRLLTPNGRPAKWADGKPEELGILPFMTCNDFTRAIAYPSKNPNTPGQYEVELQHNAIGKAKLRAVADADRTRGYCLVVNDIVLTCVNFAPLCERRLGRQHFDLRLRHEDRGASRCAEHKPRNAWPMSA